LVLIFFLSLAIYVSTVISPEEIIAAAASAANAGGGPTPWYERTPGVEIILGIRSGY